MEKAKELLQKSATLGSKNFHTHLILGLIHWRHSKNAPQAIESFQKAKNSYPNYVEDNNPYLLLSEIYTTQGDKQKAFAELEAYLKLHNTDFKTRLDLAKEYYHLQRYENAMHLLIEAQEIYPFNQELQNLLAGCCKAMKKEDLALRAYEILLGMNPKEDKHRIYTDMAEIYFSQKNFEKAKFCAEEALRIKPGFKRAQEILEKLQK
jgi:tetratricopeptide (TPR) repeat protein